MVSSQLNRFDVPGERVGHVVLAHASQFIAQYGYVGLFATVFVAALGIGVPIPVQALLLALGALSAAHGGPDFVAVALLSVGAAAGGHSTVYTAGRLGSRWVERQITRVQRNPVIQRLLRSTSGRRGGYALLTFISRFLLTPLASPVSLLAGVSRLGIGLYLILEIGGEIIYVFGSLTLGRLFGAPLLARDGLLPLFGLLVLVVMLAPVLLVRWVSALMGRRRNGVIVGEAGTTIPDQVTPATLTQE